jgi:hypothetical protein
MDCRQNSHFSRERFIAFSVASRNSFVVVSMYRSNCVTSQSQNTIHTLSAYLWTQKEYLCTDLRFHIPSYVASVLVRDSPYNGACWAAGSHITERAELQEPIKRSVLSCRSSYNGACWAVVNFDSFPFALLCWLKNLNTQQVDKNSKIEEFITPHLPNNFTFCFRNVMYSGSVKYLLPKKDTVNTTSSLRTQLLYWFGTYRKKPLNV